MIWMAIFHFSFDLANYRFTQQNFYHDPFWLHQRTVIVSMFLFCAGAGQAIALAQGQSWSRFWRRWRQIALCAVLVSIGSSLMFPNSWIYFGVLHAMAAMLILTRWMAPLGRWLWPLGAVAIGLPLAIQHPFFDHPWSAWVGLVTHKPRTEDFVPLLPWIGLMWWGMATAQAMLRRRPAWVQGPVWPALSGLARLGRHSLVFYMLHQPVLIGALLAWQAMMPHSA